MGERPLGITIIAIVLAVTGVFQIVVGLEALGITNFGLSELADEASVSGWAGIIGGVLSVVAGAGLFTLAGWAWMLAVFVLGVRVVVDVIAAVTQGISSSIGMAAIANLVISAVILWYFFRPNVRAAFGR
ncbi:MAG TPA: hypothetical protein VLA23_03330 [Candidatus Limnocylindrales bacterium]|nr:hypothetical protein [Candidatus Limnocylindrales bacterium]